MDQQLGEARRLKAALDQGYPALKIAEERLKNVDSCLAIYRTTIDLKQSDLTVRQAEQVKACQSLSLYPPEK